MSACQSVLLGRCLADELAYFTGEGRDPSCLFPHDEIVDDSVNKQLAPQKFLASSHKCDYYLPSSQCGCGCPRVCCTKKAFLGKSCFREESVFSKMHCHHWYPLLVKLLIGFFKKAPFYTHLWHFHYSCTVEETHTINHPITSLKLPKEHI